MHKPAFILMILLLVVACGTQRQLRKAYVGQPATKPGEKFGSPANIIERAGDSIYIFEKTKELRSTEISQGKFTLDPMVSPKVTKTEMYYFTVEDGIIVKTRFEEKYER